MLKILVVEDEHLSRSTLIRHLQEQLGDQALVEGVSNGSEAIEQVPLFLPDLIFMDIEMPIYNGIQAAESISRTHPDIKIVFLTAFARFDYAVGAFRAGAREYLLKPFQRQEIDDCLHRLFPSLSSSHLQTPQETSPFAQKVDAWLRLHYGEDLSLEQVAQGVGMSPFYFSRLFRTTYNQTFLEYLTDYRITSASRLLSTSDISIRDIAALVGYSDANYFSKVFKRHFGVTPREYRLSGQN